MDFQPRAEFLTKSLHRADAWVDHFRRQEFPVLASSAEALEQLRANEDDVDAHLIGQTFANDPLMTLKVLIHASNLNRERRTADAETLTSAVVLMGITPFFNLLGPQPTLEDWLAGDSEALDGVDAVLGRAERASRFALGFAAHRMDPDADILHQAALLHDFAELLLWCHAPALAKTIRIHQKFDPGLRSKVAQQQVLGVDLMSLQKDLIRAWHLPAVFGHLLDERDPQDPQDRCVYLATRAARHSMLGWDNAGLPDDLTDIGALLNLGPIPTLRLLHDLAGDPLARGPDTTM
ncbi:HDOD domain-containing protein [Inhella crocodyli]|uniref:HDOD domain-containing protein n=2 Tax=Inhella crocodyli TaxID=2499851 RepID=A0A3S2V561_9BURK|nr:HDOD domain-containing protein [Inhella crocodyli]